MSQNMYPNLSEHQHSNGSTSCQHWQTDVPHVHVKDCHSRQPPENPYFADYGSTDGDHANDRHPDTADGNHPDEFFHHKHRRHLVVIALLLLLSVASIATMAYFIAKDSDSDTAKYVSPPNITYCPTDLIRSSPLEGPTAVPVWWVEPSVANPTVDNIAYYASHQPGDLFEIGNTTVTYNFTGDEGMLSVCEFMVSVILIDGTPPKITNCPSFLDANVPDNDNKVAVSWKEPIATSDNRPVTIIKPDQSPGSYFSIGTTTMNYIFIDSLGFQSSCSFPISVFDITPPSIKNCPKDITHNVSSETGAKISWVDPEATDNSGKVSLVSQSHKPDDVFPVGGTSVEYVYSDPSGNIKLCRFVVRVVVVDGTPPVVTDCPDNLSRQAPTDDNKVIVTWTEPTAESSRPVSTIKPDPSQSPGSYFSIGTTAINYVFIDSIGLRSTCSFVIAVVDVIPPVVHQCPGEMTFNVGSDIAFKSVSWVEPEATDNSGQVSLVSQTHQPGDYFPVGSTAVQYMYEDPTGNINMCSFFVKVKVSKSSNASRTHTLNYGLLIFSILFTIFTIYMQRTTFFI